MFVGYSARMQPPEHCRLGFPLAETQAELFERRVRLAPKVPIELGSTNFLLKIEGSCAPYGVGC